MSDFRLGSETLSRLKRAHTLVGRLIGDADRRLARTGVKATERRALLHLATVGNSTDLALVEALGTDRAHLSRTVKSLAERGLIAHGPDPSHRGQRRLKLTSQGSELARALHEEWSAALSDQHAGLCDEDRATLVRIGGGEGRPLRLADDQRQWSPFEARHAGWVLDQAHAYGTLRRWDNRYVAAVAEDVSRALPPTDVHGYAVSDSQGIAGTCFLVPMEDEIHARIGGFFVAPRMQLTDVAAELLKACLVRAKELTYAGVHAIAAESENYYDALYRVSLQRSRSKRESLGFGRLEILRRYGVAFPLVPRHEREDRADPRS